MVAELTQTSLQKQTWTWQGHTIAYTVAGEGLPLVLVHGFGASLGHWRKNIPDLVSAGYRVYALDLLGFGNSDQPVLDYTLDLWQALLNDFWAEFIQTPAVYIGNSIGGLLTLMMLANYPETTRGGVLLNCAGG
jgi:pimeloyl-ACP methyl ester carboxylesterase